MTDDFDTLQTRIAACRLCAEAGHRIESRPLTHGPAAARILLIGQAPGSTEAQTGVPFSGGSGTRLFEWLRRAGFRDEAAFRRVTYFTAVTKCFPGSNPKGPGDRRTTAEERRLCRPWLEAERELLSPELIIAVGGMAVSLFYEGKPRLRDVVGETLTTEDGCVVVPLPHPSGASRWLNNPHNVGRLEQALFNLKLIKADLGL